MLFVIGFVLSLIFLEWPWRLAVVIPLAAIEIFEIMLWLKWRKIRAMTGEEGLIGTAGRAVTDCAPTGRVRVKGQLWTATCREGARAGDDVTVTAIDGLRLEVERSGARTTPIG